MGDREVSNNGFKMFEAELWDSFGSDINGHVGRSFTHDVDVEPEEKP